MSRNPETLRAWKERNREKLRQQSLAAYHRKKERGFTDEEVQRRRSYSKAWRSRNKDRQLALQREWYRRNREQVAKDRRLKGITHGGKPGPKIRFSKEESRLRRIAQQRSHQERRNLFYWTFKSQFACERCGESDPACLDFHHTAGHDKEWSIGSRAKCISREKLVAELYKCIALCSNCHRKEHYRMRGGLVCERAEFEERDQIVAEAKRVFAEYKQMRAKADER